MPRVVYVGGNFYGLRSVDALIEACRGAALDLRIVGSPREMYKQRLAASGMRVSFGGAVSYTQSLHEMAEADILIAIDAGIEPGMAAAYCPSPFLPSKLVDYLGSRRPIFGIASRGSPTWRVLECYGLPVATPERAQGALRDALLRLPDLTRTCLGNDYREFEPASVRQSFLRLFADLGVMP